MPRLIDDIRAGTLRAPRFMVKREAWQKWAKQVRAMLNDPELLVIPIDDVLSYFYEGNDKEVWDLENDFPNLTPPMPQFWAEGAMPRYIISRERGITDVASLVPNGGREGFLVTALEARNVKGEDLPENARWYLWLELFIDYGAGRIEGPHGSIFLAIDAEGRAIGVPIMQTYSGPEHEEVMKSFIGWINPVLLAICRMNAKIEVK